MHSYKRSELMNINNNFYQKLHKRDVDTDPSLSTYQLQHAYALLIPPTIALNHT